MYNCHTCRQAQCHMYWRICHILKSRCIGERRPTWFCFRGLWICIQLHGCCYAGLWIYIQLDVGFGGVWIYIQLDVGFGGLWIYIQLDVVFLVCESISNLMLIWWFVNLYPIQLILVCWFVNLYPTWCWCWWFVNLYPTWCYFSGLWIYIHIDVVLLVCESISNLMLVLVVCESILNLMLFFVVCESISNVIGFFLLCESNLMLFFWFVNRYPTWCCSGSAWIYHS